MQFCSQLRDLDPEIDQMTSSWKATFRIKILNS